MSRQTPAPLASFLADRTAVSIQQQNIATPITPKRHDPYGVSVIPQNPEEVMMHRSLSQMDPTTSPLFARSTHSPYGFEATTSPLSRHASIVEFPPVSPYGSFSASPYQEAVEALSVPPPLRMPAQPLTKVYIGGRPMAIPSAPQTQVSSPVVASPVAAAPSANTAVEEPQLTKDVVLTVAFRRGQSTYAVIDAPAVLGSARAKSQLVGRFVIVDGDRGEDIGRIVHANEATRGDDYQNLNLVRRFALREEVARYDAMRIEEQRALEYAQQQAARLFPSEQLSIDDATFQFDKQKLTLWYRVPDRVYFVPLLKTLNQAYRCRIWMERMDE